MEQNHLAMTNSELALGQCRLVARNLWNEVVQRVADESERDQEFLTTVFEQVLSRRPTSREIAICRDFMHKQVQLYDKTDAKRLKQSSGNIVAASSDPTMRARESLVRALFSHNDFVTIH